MPGMLTKGKKECFYFQTRCLGYFRRFQLPEAEIPFVGKELLAFHETIAEHFIDKYYGVKEQTVCHSDLDPSGDTKYFSHTNKCYSAFDNDVTWVTARANCMAQGGELASVLDQDTQEFLKYGFWPENSCVNSR